MSFVDRDELEVKLLQDVEHPFNEEPLGREVEKFNGTSVELAPRVFRLLVGET
jgi:hypothetical protein